jgi:pimeloyl-ACP methyl ester carboxylesterase
MKGICRAIQLSAMIAVLVTIGACAKPDPYTPPIKDDDGNVVPGSISSIETVMLGGVAQTITIRGVDRTKPVLLHLHGGPGMPSSPWATWNGYYADLEADFVLVHWDQRGAGKSYSQDLTADDMHVMNFVSDTLQLTDVLRERFNQDQIFLWGHSWGSGLGFETLRLNSEPYHAFFASAVRPEWNASQMLGYEHVLQLARQAADTEAIEALTAIQPFDATNPEHLNVKGQIQSQYLVGNFHTDGLEQAWLDYATKGRSPEYPRSTVRNTMAGLAFSKETIGQEIIDSGYNHARDFPVSKIPVFFFAGRYDYVTPGELAEDYFEMLEAPAKSFIWFENSAHDVQYDEPDKFSQEIIRIAQEVLNP